MRSADEVRVLLDRLDHECADDLEGQDLDFKQWDTGSMRAAVAKVVEAVVCMANGGGGTVVLGVADRIVGRSQAILGVPAGVDAPTLRGAIHERTDPRLIPEIHELAVPEGSGRLLVVQINPGRPPYTDSGGRAHIRVGADCRPLTGSTLTRLVAEVGEADFTAGFVEGRVDDLISPAAMEQLRDIARRDRAPEELLRSTDSDLLTAIGVVRDGRLTRAGVLLAGRASAIRAAVPQFSWTYLRMRSEDDYSDRIDGQDALALTLPRLEDRIQAENPIQTVQQGLFHFEVRTYPEVALREILMNAFGHADYRVPSPILMKHFDGRLEVSNPGGLIGGVTPQNILHHPPVTRNPCLVEALVRLRLVNRSNLGIQRVYRALLMEGKEPPVIEDFGEVVRVMVRASDLSVQFRAFVEEEEVRGGRFLGADHLLVLQFLTRHIEIDTNTVARLCQRTEPEAREILAEMERTFGFLDRGGSGAGSYWVLRRRVHERLALPGHPDRDRRLDWEAAKARVLSVLRSRAESGEGGLSNSEIRRITQLSRSQAWQLMTQLRAEYPQIQSPGRGRSARYVWLD